MSASVNRRSDEKYPLSPRRRRHLLEVDETDGSNLGPIKSESLQRRQPREVCQTRVGDLGVSEEENLQRLQPGEVRQARVGDMGEQEVEYLQRRQPREVCQARVGDLVANEKELYNLPLFVFVTHTPSSVSTSASNVGEGVGSCCA